MTIDNTRQDKAKSRLSAWLESKGVNPKWAKVIASAIIAGVVAGIAALQSNCAGVSATYEQHLGSVRMQITPPVMIVGGAK